MTDRAQFEAMLEALINDDQQAAKEIFHNIVVGKSREIYEELLESDFSQDQGNPYGTDLSEEGEDEEEPMAEEGEDEMPMAEEDDEDKESDDEEDPETEIDRAEDDADAIAADAEDEEETDGDIEDRVMDLEDALEDLKAEFEQLMAGEEHEEHDHPGIHDLGGDDMGGDEFGSDSEMDDLMEYVIPVKDGHGAERKGVSSKTVGSGSYENAGENYTRSPVAGKNDMGGSSANIVAGHVEVHGDAGKRSKVEGPGVMNSSVRPNPDAKGNVNVPGGKAGKTAFKTQVKGGGIDRQSGFEKEGHLAGTGAHGQSAGKNTQSTLRPIKK
jgi:hypothetical protein